MKFVELVRCDSDFPVRDCSVCARKRDKLYVRECMALIIGLREMLDVLLVVRVVLMGEDLLIWFYWECCFVPPGFWYSV